jgi:membrane protease YdiL (CAAX protease family)
MNRHPLASYYVLACAISWAFQIPLALSAQGLVDWTPPPGLHFFGALGPILAAAIVTGVTQGSAGLRDLLRRMARWRVGAKWLLFATFSPAVGFLIGAAVLSALRGDWSVFSQFGYIAELPRLSWPVAWIVWTLTFGFGEETGWRGFMLPRLQRCRDARSATFILSLLWAFWHVPTFFYNYTLDPFGLLAFVISLTAGAVVLTWLYNSTGGSILVAALWHGALNTAVAGAPGEIASFVSACVIFGAITILRRYGPATLSLSSKYTI